MRWVQESQVMWPMNAELWDNQVTKMSPEPFSDLQVESRDSSPELLQSLCFTAEQLSSIRSSSWFRWEGGQPGAADRDRKWRVTSAAEVMWSCLHHLTRLQLWSPQTLFTSSSVSSSCVSTSSPEIFVLVSSCLCPVLEASPPPLSESSSAVFTLLLDLDFTQELRRRKTNWVWSSREDPENWGAQVWKQLLIRR